MASQKVETSIFSSFRRSVQSPLDSVQYPLEGYGGEPEPSVVWSLQRIWAPAFAGVTTLCEFIIDDWGKTGLMQFSPKKRGDAIAGIPPFFVIAANVDGLGLLDFAHLLTVLHRAAREVYNRPAPHGNPRSAPDRDGLNQLRQSRPRH